MKKRAPAIVGNVFLPARFSKCVQGTMQTLAPDILKSHEVDEILEALEPAAWV